MPEAIAVLSTCGNEEEASRIGRALVENRLAACVNILPAVQSIYRWQGQIETGSEVLLIIKTTEQHFPELRQRIVELHSYQTPEIIALPIITGLDKYLAWLREQV